MGDHIGSDEGQLCVCGHEGVKAGLTAWRATARNRVTDQVERVGRGKVHEWATNGSNGTPRKPHSGQPRRPGNGHLPLRSPYQVPAIARDPPRIPTIEAQF